MAVPSEGGEARPGTERAAKFLLTQRELDVLCESLWHSLSRADVPDEDIDAMRELRERLNDARR
jgi:hypothetical protein